MAEAMVDSWQLATISMWVDKLNNHEVIKLISETFEWEELWEAAAEVNQLCASKEMISKIPKNRDQGEQRDRVAVLSNAMLLSLAELKARADKPVFIVSSKNLSKVPGVVKDCVQAEPAVTARLDNIEKMVEGLAKGFKDMKAANQNQWPALQVNGDPAQAGGRQVGQQQANLGARSRLGGEVIHQQLGTKVLV